MRLRVSISSRLASSTGRREPPPPDETTLLGFLCRYTPEHSSKPASGLWVHLKPRRTLLPTDRLSLEANLPLPELLGIARGTEHLRQAQLGEGVTVVLTGGGAKALLADLPDHIRYEKELVFLGMAGMVAEKGE